MIDFYTYLAKFKDKNYIKESLSEHSLICIIC